MKIHTFIINTLDQNITPFSVLPDNNDTESGNTLYLTSDNNGYQAILRNNNTIIWKTQISYFTLGATIERLGDYIYEDPNGFFIAGTFELRGVGYTAYSAKGVIRINKTTGVVDKFYNLSPIDFNFINETISLASTHGGNIAIGGSLQGKAYIEVIDANGTVLLTKSSSGSSQLWGSFIQSIIKTNDTGYILSGFVEENTSCNTTGNKNRSWWLCKTDKDFNVLWSKKYGNGTGTVDLKRVLVDNSGEIIALGSTECTQNASAGPFNLGPGNWLLRLSSSGNYVNGGINAATNIKDVVLSCNGSLLALKSFVNSIGTTKYGIDKLNYSFGFQSAVYTGNSSLEPVFESFPRLQLNKNDNTYLISGYNSNVNKGTIVKTTPDPACSYNPPTGCSGLSGGLTRYSDCENFDAFQTGNLVPQASPRFTLFSNQSYEHAQVTTERAFSGNKSLKFTSTSDIDFNIERMIQSPTRLEWMTYLPVGKTGSWALETIPNNPEALFIEWNNGNATVYVYENNVWVGRAYFTYTPGTWFRTALIFNNSRNTIELWVGRKLVYTLTNYTSLRITDLNFFATQGSPVNEFYVDDIVYYEIATNIACTSEYNPVCISEKDQEFRNPCFAGLSAYTPNEWTSGPCNGPPPPPSSLTVDIDNNVCGASGSIVEVPVRVSGYTGVAALQMIIASSNNSAAEILGVTSINPNTDIASSDFILTSGRLGLAYAFRPNTLANGSVLFSVRVRLNGSAGTNALLTFDGQIVAADNAVNTINATGLSGSVCISVATSSVSGTISTAASRVMAGVTVRTTTGSTLVNTALTNTSGNYSVVNLTNGTSYTITPSFSDGLKDGLDVTDMLIMRRHMLGAALFTNGYMYVAADLNFDRVINVSDLLILRKIILDEITSLSGGVSPWRFIPSSYAFPLGNPLSGTIPSTISYNPLNGNQTGQNFTGVKYGDLNNSANFTEKTDDEGRSTGEVLLEIPEVSGKPGEEVSVDIRCRGFERGAGMQFSLRWPADELELLGVEPNEEGPGGTTWYNEQRKERGMLGLVWESEDLLRGTDVEDGGLCYRLRFRILGKGGSVAEIRADEGAMQSVFVDSDLQKHRMSIQGGVVRVAETSATDEEGWQSVGVYPNPTTGILHLEYGSHTPQSVMLQTMEGTVLKKVSGSEKTMDLSDLTAGVYMLRMQFDSGMVSRKVIVIK